LISRLSSDQRRAAWDGLRFTFMLSPSYLMFGTVCGLASKQAGLDALQAFLLPGLVFGGSSQVVFASLIIGGAPLVVVVLSAAMVNARMAVYSAAFSQRLLDAPQWLRTAIAPLIVDQTFLGVEGWRAEQPDNPHWIAYYFGAGLSLWLWWVGCNMLGYYLGTVVPPSWQLDFVVPLSFVAVIAPMLKRLPFAVAAGLGAVLGVLLFAMPMKLGLITACVLGVAICMALDWKFSWTP
jgi:4-azaleucine resistance transporter AzlC